MKKFTSVFLALVALFALTVTPVLAASGNLTLRETRNDRGGGVIFVFEYTGEFTDADFKGGSVLLNGQYYPLDCNIVEGEGVVQCTASRALAGERVQVFLAGFTFWDKVPESRGFGGGSETYCYNVYDWDFHSESESLIWVDFADHCQDAPANYGDIIDGYTPPWFSGGPFEYEFMPGSPSCDFFSNSVDEDAYIGDCPEN